MRIWWRPTPLWKPARAGIRGFSDRTMRAQLVSWMDVPVKRHPSLFRQLTELPSVTFHRHVYGSFLWDTVGVANKDMIGVDNMMWCNDFPHSYGPWPRSSDQMQKDLGGMDERERYEILAGNAVRVFNL